jgi:hypothetical protein
MRKIIYADVLIADGLFIDIIKLILLIKWLTEPVNTYYQELLTDKFILETLGLHKGDLYTESKAAAGWSFFYWYAKYGS